MTREERSELWHERLVDLTASGLTQKQWCERNGVPAHQLAYWKRRLSDAESAGATGAGPVVDWFPVQLMPKAGSALNGLEVRIGVAHILVQSGFDPALLAGVVRALTEIAEPGRGRHHG